MTEKITLTKKDFNRLFAYAIDYRIQITLHDNDGQYWAVSYVDRDDQKSLAHTAFSSMADTETVRDKFNDILAAVRSDFYHLARDIDITLAKDDETGKVLQTLRL